MKIFSIFAERLFAFQYENEELNELRRILREWNDSIYLFEFIKQNKSDIPKTISGMKIVNQLIVDANEIDNTLIDISKNPNRKLEEFFKPLNNQEYQFVSLSKQKGRKNYLRLYAIKIDDNCFVITGGAIKFHHLMKDRPHTQRELSKLDRCREFLKENGIIDSDSFFEFLNEQQ